MVLASFSFCSFCLLVGWSSKI